MGILDVAGRRYLDTLKQYAVGSQWPFTKEETGYQWSRQVKYTHQAKKPAQVLGNLGRLRTLAFSDQYKLDLGEDAE